MLQIVSKNRAVRFTYHQSETRTLVGIVRRMVRRRLNCAVPSCVNYCNNLREQCYRFPANKKVAEDWVRVVNNQKLKIEEAHLYCFSKYVCHRHFATHQFTTPKRLRLNRGAIPTLFLTSSDNSENCPLESEIHKVVSSVRNGSIDKFAEPPVSNKYQLEKANVKEETNMGTCEEAGSQALPHLDSGMHSCVYNNVRVKQPPQKVQESAENLVQEDLVEDILTESIATKHASSNGKQTDLQNVCRELVADVDIAADGTELSEMCDTGSHQGNTDEYEDIKLTPSESYMVATDTWEYLPNGMCRLCASADEHPKQSIVGWLHMLNEVIPDLVAVNDGLPQHVCRPCTNKLYTCNKIKADFIEAYKKLQECFGFTKSPGIQFLHLPAAVSSYQPFNELTEEQLVSEDEQLVYDVEEHLVSEVEEQLISTDEEQLVSGGAEQLACGTEEPLVYEVEEQLVSKAEEQLVSGSEEQSACGTGEPLVYEVEEQLASEVEEQLVSEDEEHLGPVSTSEDFSTREHKMLIEVREVALNNMSDLSLNVEESAISYIDSVAAVKGSSPKDKSDHAGNTSSVCGMMVQKVEMSNKKYKYVCGECEEMFTGKASLNVHKLTHVNILECEYCKRHFTSIAQLDDHRRIHTKELPFMCEVCGKCFRTVMKLNTHKYIHEPPKYVCQVCSKKFRSMFYLTQHKKMHYRDAKVICEVCGKMLYTASSLKIHLRIHTGEKPFQCADCGKCFISAGRLRNHRRTHADKNFRCDSCGKEYYFKYSLLQHQECHNNPKLYRCPICFTQFANPQNMKRHRKMYCKKPICIVCNETFLSDETVHEHQVKEHTDQEVAVAANCYGRRQHFKCPVCSQSVYGKQCLLKHMECHGDYTLACEQCPKTFSSTSMLLAHRICHSEQRLFRCATCGKRFKTKYTLKCHDLSVHKNECPFHCPSCDQQFKRLSDFIVHKRKHTGERPFTCPICMRKFFTKSYMLKHAKKHSQSSENVAWREVVEGTIPVSEVVLPSQDLSCGIGVAEQVV